MNKNLALVARARATAYSILQRARANGWADVDPYDGLAGFADSLLPQRAILLRRLVIQGVMRSPPALRRVLGISPRQEAYTIGVLLSAAALLDDPAMKDELAKALLANRLTDTGSWGYAFPVVTRAAHYGPDSPNLVSTSFAASGLLDLAERDPPPVGSEERIALREAVEWLLESAWDPEGRRFRYHSGNTFQIYNASALASCVVARANEAFGSQTNGVVETALQQVFAAQLPDGSWPYGNSRSLDWIDNHHTGFVLKSLLLLPPHFRSPEWEDRITRGLGFYQQRLIDADGAPRATPARRYPLDSLAAGQAIETLTLGAGILGSRGCRRDAHRVFTWTEEHLKRPDGRYYFRKGRLFPWPGSYLRWGEAHIALGAARLSQLE